MLRLASVLVLCGAALLLVMAAMHGAGYEAITKELRQSELSDFAKRTLPAMWLYPSAAMTVLALVSITALLWPVGRRTLLGFVAVVAAANSALGFILGGALPGGIMLATAALFGIAYYLMPGRGIQTRGRAEIQ
ncbi:MAG: hypothetical protein AAFX44_02525 [Pseudomonadota bacterium]